MRLATGVRRRGSGLAAGQGSGKNVGLGARGPGLPSFFCVAAGEPLHVSLPLLSPVSCRTTGVGSGDVLQQRRWDLQTEKGQCLVVMMLMPGSCPLHTSQEPLEGTARLTTERRPGGASRTVSSLSAAQCINHLPREHTAWSSASWGPMGLWSRCSDKPTVASLQDGPPRSPPSGIRLSRCRLSHGTGQNCKATKNCHSDRVGPPR